MVAKKLGISTIICPLDAGTASAFGLLIAPARTDRSRTISYKPDINLTEDLDKNIQSLESEIQISLKALSESYGPIQISHQAEARFVGQGFNLLFNLPILSQGNALNNESIKNSFLEAYTEKFGRIPPNGVIELVNLRISGSAPPLQNQLLRQDEQIAIIPSPKLRQVYFEESNGFIDTPVFNRSELGSNFQASGPLLIEESSTTIVVGPSGLVRLSPNGNLIISIQNKV
jgi:N-methylhydantoinase A